MSNSSLLTPTHFMSTAMPVSLPPGFANPPTPPPSIPIREFFGHNQKQRIEELEERVTELEIQNDRLKTGMHNFNVDRNEADDRIDDLERQVGDLFNLVMRMNAPCTCSKPASKPPSPENLLLGEMNRLRISRGSQSSQ